jgi:hypothetical protein
MQTAALSIGHFLCIRMGGEDRLVEGKLAHVRFEANSLWILPASWMMCAARITKGS